MQLGLFGSGPASFDGRFGQIRRWELGRGAWIEHHPLWLDGHQGVFEALATHAPWQQHRRVMYEREVDVPRLVARAPREGAMARLLARLAQTLRARYARPFESISLAHYRDGRDSVAFHGDKMGRLVSDCVVATVSVGAPRRFLMKPMAGGESLSFDLGLGDLFVMGGTCQRTWQHAIPKRAHAEPRISIMFRPQVPAD